MKLAKKVLSVLLAVVIALGAFAVVGSANGPVDSDYQIKMWLTGSVGTATWTTNSRVTIDEGDESDPGATIEVQPGDTVFVRVYVTNNYYVHTIQANLFYSAGLIDSNEDYKAQRGVTTDISKANLKKIHIWNSDNYWADLQGTSYSAQNNWSMQAMEGFNDDVEQNWPTDDQGNNLFTMADWKFNRFNNLVSSGVGETCMFDDDSVHLIMMPVKVPTNAAPGTTYYVTIPEGLEQRSAKPQGALRLYENGICADCEEPCEVVDTQAALNPNMKYSDDNQYWDLSEATLTLQVPGEAGVDTAELEAKLAEAAGLLDDGLTADSIAALNDAITTGNAALTSNDQATVNAAVTVLTDAINGKQYLADFAALNEQISRYDLLDADAYDATSFANATAKYNDAKAIDQTNEADQDKVNAAAAALKDAIDNLAAALDYSALEAKYNELVNKDVANYTDDTVARFNAALAAAKSLIDNKNAIDQDEINAVYDELVAADAALALKDADYTALEEAKAAFTALNAKDWTSASYANAQAKYDAACAVAPGLKITDQAIIDTAADELNAAIKALVPATGANYDELNAAKAEFEAVVAANYTTDSYAAAKTAYDAACEVPADLTSEQQAQIDEAAAALNKALDELVEADADYSAVTAAQVEAQAILDKKDGGVNSYSDETLEAINEALAGVETGLKKKDQARVDAMAAAIEAAVDNATFRAWDYQPILDHIAAIEANPADYYDADEYAAYLAKKEALVWDYTYEQYAKAMLQQINFLKVTVAAAGPADYSSVEDAIAAFEAKKAAANYTADSIAAVDAEIAKVNYNLNVNHQDEVEAYADAIYAAIDAMVEEVVELVDYTRLDAAIAAAKDLDANLYTSESYYEVSVALYTAESISRELAKEGNQEYVDDVAKTLEDAIAALEELADYSDLEAAILRAGTYDQNVWTPETWAVVVEKLAAAKAVAPGLGVSAQDVIDEAAAALNKALDDLEAKEVVSSISTINWTPSEDTHNTFSVAVNGRPAMIQFIEMDNGTRTYDRYNKNVTIKSYNANNEEVNSLSRDVAYEIWTINTNLIGPDVKARAKYLSGASYIWEKETYNFTVKTLEPTFDADIRSITPAATSGKKGAVATTVVVGPDAQGIRFVMDNGTTTTYYADKATVLDNGDLEFAGKAWANNEGLNTIIVKVRVNNAWVEAGTIEYTVE